MQDLGSLQRCRPKPWRQFPDLGKHRRGARKFAARLVQVGKGEAYGEASGIPAHRLLQRLHRRTSIAGGMLGAGQSPPAQAAVGIAGHGPVQGFQ